jgi:hypothetical protein
MHDKVYISVYIVLINESTEVVMEGWAVTLPGRPKWYTQLS